MSETMDRKIVFRRMTERDKFDALFEMIMNIQSEITRDKAEIVMLRNSITHLQGEMEGIGYRRHDDDTMTTTQKFNLAMDQRFTGWLWYRDKILAPTIAQAQTIIFLAVLYLAFGGRMP